MKHCGDCHEILYIVCMMKITGSKAFAMSYCSGCAPMMGRVKYIDNVPSSLQGTGDRKSLAARYTHRRMRVVRTSIRNGGLHLFFSSSSLQHGRVGLEQFLEVTG